jgi:hypothetical protein
VFTPMPRARVTRAMTVKPGVLRRERKANFMGVASSG